MFGSHCGAQVSFSEGEEPEEFWDALGGKQEFMQYKACGIPADFEPRLFNVSNSGGYLFVKEIFGFVQEDLDNTDVHLLDCYSTVYVWIGNKSNKAEREGAYDRAEAYLKSIQDGRDVDDVNIVEVHAGKEPPSF